MRLKFDHKQTKFTFFTSNKKQFNQTTLYNAQQYLIKNKDSITFHKNESGFIRMTFPDSVLAPDDRIHQLENGDVLRANFWFYKSSESGLGDESIHDHPREFQSYIVSGGYEHIIYRVVNERKKIFIINLYDFIAKNTEILPPLQAFTLNLSALHSLNLNINYPTPYPELTRNFKFTLDKSLNNISYKGVTILEPERTESTKKGDIIEIDTNLIHRVTRYHMFANEKTLSLNIVRDKGKKTTNIYLPEMKVTAVKTSRDEVNAEEAKQATEELIEIFAKSLRSFE